jgi:hypothetical protein
MATATVAGLKAKTDAAYANISKQLQGMEPYLDKSDAPGEWTARQVICHLLFEPGWDVVGILKSFSTSNLPVIEIQGGASDTSGAHPRVRGGAVRLPLERPRGAAREDSQGGGPARGEVRGPSMARVDWSYHRQG